MGSDLLLETYLKRLRLPTVTANFRRYAQEATHPNQPNECHLPALRGNQQNRMHPSARNLASRSNYARTRVLLLPIWDVGWLRPWVAGGGGCLRARGTMIRQCPG